MISTQIHALLDYLSATALIAGPRWLGWRHGLRRPLTAAGLGTLGYSLITRYEGGVVPVLPMRGHLALDRVQGAAFCTAAALARGESRAVRLALAGYGLFALAASALTETEGESAGLTSAAARRTDGGAGRVFTRRDSPRVSRLPVE